MPGYPIRTPSDQRSVDNSPRTIAASHVLHRLLVPRHPPCALDNLTNTHIKKSRHNYSTETKDARVHCTILNDHTNRGRTPPPRRSRPRSPQRGHPLRTQQCAAPTHHRRETCPVLPLSSRATHLPPPEHTAPGRYRRPSTPTPAMAADTRHDKHHRPGRSVKLLRKEVIQPHLPVRLPCYDFVPIASPTFDRSPHKGWATGFGCYRLS